MHRGDSQNVKLSMHTYLLGNIGLYIGSANYHFNMTQFEPVQDCRIPDLKRMFRHYERRFDVLLKTGFAFLVRQPTSEAFPSSLALTDFDIGSLAGI